MKKEYSFEDIIDVEKAYDFHPLGPEVFKKIKEAIAFAPSEFRTGMEATMDAQVVTYVLNNDDTEEGKPWLADYNNNEDKWGWWTRGGSADGSGSGFRFVGSDDGWALANTYGGARFACKCSKRNNHFKEYFPHLFKEHHLIIKK